MGCRKGMIVVWLLLTGCIEPDLVQCANGLACSGEQVCDLVHDRCVAPDQLTACVGLDPGADCATSMVSGGCFDGVCLARGCGNAIIEAGESCDDGNQLSGDGCRNDCRSDESCGNTIVDPGPGETCDDGNRLSHDGCDSACSTETSTWAVVPLVPHCHAGIYDPSRTVYVCVTNDSTWEMSGTTWALASQTTVLMATFWYDPDTATVHAVNRTSGETWAWNGVAWSREADGVGPIAAVAFDRQRHVPIALAADGGLWALSGAGGWSREPATIDLAFIQSIGAAATWIEFYADSDVVGVHFWGRWHVDYEYSCNDYCFEASGTADWVYYAHTVESYPGPQPVGFALTRDTLHGRWLSLSGNELFATAGANRVRRVDASGTISTVAGIGMRVQSMLGDGGLARDAGLSRPSAVTFDAAGNLYIADSNNLRIRRVDTNGTITTVVGTGVSGFSGDGGPATNAQLSYPVAVATDPTGNLYIADSIRIRRVDTNGVITTFAGDGSYTYVDGVAATATGMVPYGIAVDSAGNVYVTDGGSRRVRKIDGATGVITSFAGTGGYGASSGDGGPATNAVMPYPTGIAVDTNGTVFITSGNRVRRVAGGIITTVAGTDAGGYQGDGGPATAALLSGPTGLTLDSAGNLYIADTGNARVRRVDSSGIITTVVGTGITGDSGDGNPAVLADLGAPVGVAIGPGGLYVSDVGASRAQPPGSGGYAHPNATYIPSTDSLLSVSTTHNLVMQAGTWTLNSLGPSSTLALSVDAPSGRLIAFDYVYAGAARYLSRTWMVDAGWQTSNVPDPIGPRFKPALAYDWGRRAAVLVGGSTSSAGSPLGGTYALDADNSWQLVDANSAPPGTPAALAYDPELPGLVMATNGHLYQLPSTASTWTDLGTLASLFGQGTSIVSFAFDRASSRLVAMGASGDIWSRVAGTWQKAQFALTHTGDRLVADERRGHVVMLPLDGTSTDVFEYDQGGWRATEPLPFPVSGVATYDPAAGTIVIVGDGLTSAAPDYRFALVRTLSSSLPDETCQASEDADGDGLAACADPDCYWSCSRCPLTGCP